MTKTTGIATIGVAGLLCVLGALYLLCGCQKSRDLDLSKHELLAKYGDKDSCGSTAVIFLKPSFEASFDLVSYSIKTDKGSIVPLKSLGLSPCKMGSGPGLNVFFACDMAKLPSETKEVLSVFDFRMESHRFILKSVFVRQAGSEWKADDKRLTIEEVPW